MSKNKLKICTRQRCKNKAEIHRLYGVLPCMKHQKEDEGQGGTDYEFATLSQSDRTNQQRDEYGADMIQPWQPDGKTVNKAFTEHYPQESEDYFSQKELESL